MENKESEFEDRTKEIETETERKRLKKANRENSISNFICLYLYDLADLEQRFACASQEHPTNSEIVKLYLYLDVLKIQCLFQSYSEVSANEFLSVFTSGGLAPSLRIINSTYSGTFHFNLTSFSDQVSWLIEIPRENITTNTDIAAVEEWFVRISLQNGLNIYTTGGTLLDQVREPILQWTLGHLIAKEKVSTLYPHVVGLKVTKVPCANDVALLGFILNSNLDGVYIGLTSSGFWNYNDTLWYNLTDMIYSHFGEEHLGLTVVDMVLTNHFFVILTSLGLFVSGDLRYPKKPALILLSRAEFCGFERIDYVKGKLWYNERCFANRERFEVDYITITFERNRTLSEASSCFYSKEPFFDWLPCLPYISKTMKTTPSTVITFLIDQEHYSGIYLFNNEVSLTTTASVSNLKNNIPRFKPKFPVFTFPPSFSYPVGMVFHPRSHFLYAYGNQVWLSVDGGNTFELLADFHEDIIKHSYHSFYTSTIAFVSRSGKVYKTKAGLESYSKAGYIIDRVFTLYYDHMGFIHKLTPGYFKAEGPPGDTGTSQSIFIEDSDMGFQTALVPQFTNINEMIFYAYVPENEPMKSIHTKQFSKMHLGKQLTHRKFGMAYVKNVVYHDLPERFLSAAIVEIIDPFAVENEKWSSAILSSLYISQERKFYKLNLQTPRVDSRFKDTDFEKTVVIPGYCSFLIIEVLDDTNALAIPTMLGIIPNYKTFLKDSWFLYNFGQKNGRLWKIKAKPCNYWFEQHDDSLSLSVLKYIDLGQTKNLKLKVIPNTRGIRIREVPLLKIIVGNPNLLDVQAEGIFDYTDSYILDISITSKTLTQGSTSLAFVMWRASTNCFVTTFVATLKSSCSYLKTMHHIPSILIPLKDWISGIHKDSQGFNRIKTLPTNYRPPSNMGIAIPITDNFYNADPSKPIPRNLFYKSKKHGKFKQCANMSSRAKCNCSQEQKFSYDVAFSDCREKVPRYKFPVTEYPIALHISSEDGHIPIKTHHLVTVTEVNKRENWKLQHTVPANIRKLKTYLESLLHTSVYNPLGLNLSITGSELFHFRVSIVSGFTFCNLEEEFQIYVDQVPLPFPGHTLIAIAAAVVLGGLIFIVFVYKIRHTHPTANGQTFSTEANVGATPLAKS
ncbi:cation channel sperm-associated auxiliary subunit beta [Saccopteryx bilineata]|uniref:cation channel sperm-associated auxiliary subunit beta n=1 Tax=Saccopteryx bilineata TaxID=59482 RepID=UPI00338D6FE5